MATALFISYDGLTDHIAVSQVLPYVLGLARRGIPMAVLSFEKDGVAPARIAETAGRLAEAGVRWIRAPYHRGSVAKTLPLHLSTGLARVAAARLGPIRLVHARSYIPSILGLALGQALGAPLLFDMRGFWVDEKVETGLWSRGLLYSTGKTLEGPLFRRAAAIVSLTEAGARELRRWPGLAKTPIAVIPTSVDLQRFPHSAPAPRADRPLVAGYVGSFGQRYLTDDMVGLFAELRRRSPGARLRVLSPAPGPELEAALGAHGVPREALAVGAVPHAEVGRELAEMDFTFCLVKPGFAALASCPTKFGESLAIGRPVVTNRGLGDCAEIVERERVGVATDLSPGERPAVVGALLELLGERGLSERCRRVAEARFALDHAIDTYAELYDRISTRGRRAA